MKRSVGIVSMLVLALGGASGLCAESPAQNPSTSGAPTDAAHAIQRACEKVAETVNPSIVCVTSYVRIENAPAADKTNKWQSAAQQDHSEYRRLATSSGVVVDEAGTILTCRHSLLTPQNTIADVVDVEMNDAQHFYAKVVGSEPTLNLAVLRLEVFEDGPKPVIKLAKIVPMDDVKPGSAAIAVGDPFGSLRTFAPGVVAAMPAQECYQADLTSTFVQATMTVNPETCGGVLASLDSEVFGIIMPPPGPSGELQIQGQPGVTFALPMTTAMTVGTAIRQTQTHESPWMGFAVLSMGELRRKTEPNAFDQMKKPLYGIYIQDVFTPSPATEADIRVGDFLLTIDGERIGTVAAFQRRLYLSQVGHVASLEIFRDGETLKKSLKVEKRAPKANERP